MKRRQFLKSVAALAGAAVLPGTGAQPLSEGLVFFASGSWSCYTFRFVEWDCDWAVGFNEDGTVATVDTSDLFLPKQPPSDVF